MKADIEINPIICVEDKYIIALEGKRESLESYEECVSK